MLGAAFLLAACGSDQPTLMNIKAQGNGPDEFAILPPKPLEMPESLADLPEPTPGGMNRTDPRPNDDAVIALGGKPSTGGIPASDGALVAQASRFGTTSGIRQQLAAEDLDYRRRKDGRLLERLFNVNVYYRAYEPMSLDQFAELERWRRAGAGNPSAPPPQAGE
jgi:hypothetical protein